MRTIYVIRLLVFTRDRIWGQLWTNRSKGNGFSTDDLVDFHDHRDYDSRKRLVFPNQLVEVTCEPPFAAPRPARRPCRFDLPLRRLHAHRASDGLYLGES